jgi:hypothetical protein
MKMIKYFLLAFLLVLPGYSASRILSTMSSTGNGVQFNIVKSADQYAYYIQIRYKGIGPEGIAVMPVQGGVVIKSTRQQRQQQITSYGAVQYYSSGQAMQSRVGIPPDGDLSRLGRNDKPGLIELVIPRKRR